MQSRPILLIDADPIVYKAASASEDELDFDPDLTVVVGNFRRGKQIVEQEIKNLTIRFETPELLLFFTDTVNFRKEVDPTYKGNRVRRKPAGYKKLKEWCKVKWCYRQLPGLEADDGLGIAATSGEFKSFILCSPDKDMQQFPCRIWDGKEEYTQTQERATYKRWLQALTGDATDGYGGAPGVGPKKAEAILKKVKDGDYYSVVRDTFIQVGLEEEDAIRNIRLATILTSDMWDEKNQRPILFTP
jgi:DNA polymerase-1